MKRILSSIAIVLVLFAIFAGVVSSETYKSDNVTNENNTKPINENDTKIVPTPVQPTITPTDVTTDKTLIKATPVDEQTTPAPIVYNQTTIFVKNTDLYTGQIVTMLDKEVVKEGLKIEELNTGLNGCEYIVLNNTNDFNMSLGGYVIYIYETETGIRLPNIEIAANKSVKIFTVNGNPDTYDQEGDLQKFHFRLAQELYPDETSVHVYLFEPNFNKAISSITT